MKVLELFSGNGDISRAFSERGHKVVSVDYDERTPATFHCDVYALPDGFLKQFNFIWLSPDCTTYSFVSHGLHRRAGGVPVSEYAKRCDDNNAEFIARLKRLGIPFIMENPRAHFRKRPFVEGLERITVYYSTYGATYAKPTDLFSNKVELLKLFNTSYTKPTAEFQRFYARGINRCLFRSKMPQALISDIVLSAEQLEKGGN